jgi:transposase
MEPSSASGGVLYLAIELGEKKWKVATTTGLGARPRQAWIAGRSVKELLAEIERAKRRFGLEASSQVVSCYEAGRDGFWVHRMLGTHGVENVVVDSSSIEVNRRRRRAKSDQLDADSLLRMLIRYQLGEKKVWQVVRVPSAAAEDLRHVQRGLGTLKKERTRQINRIKGLLAAVGVTLGAGWKELPHELDRVRQWDGSPLGEGLRRRLGYEHERLMMIARQIREVEAGRREAIRVWPEGVTRAADPQLAAKVAEQARKLIELRAIGDAGGWLFASEIFAWREIRNRRQIGALSGLVPTPYQSGESSHEQGVSKAGNRYVRAMAVELAWRWLHYQPQSALSRWYHERFARGGPRMRKIGIVAVARKLLVALWRYLEHGVVPEGAMLKPSQA